MTPDKWDRRIRELFWETWVTLRVPLLLVIALAVLLVLATT